MPDCSKLLKNRKRTFSAELLLTVQFRYSNISTGELIFKPQKGHIDQNSVICTADWKDGLILNPVRDIMPLLLLNLHQLKMVHCTLCPWRLTLKKHINWLLSFNFQWPKHSTLKQTPKHPHYTEVSEFVISLKTLTSCPSWKLTLKPITWKIFRGPTWNRSFKSVNHTVVLSVSITIHGDALQLGICVRIQDTDKVIDWFHCPWQDQAPKTAANREVEQGLRSAWGAKPVTLSYYPLHAGSTAGSSSAPPSPFLSFQEKLSLHTC